MRTVIKTKHNYACVWGFIQSSTISQPGLWQCPHHPGYPAMMGEGASTDYRVMFHLTPVTTYCLLKLSTALSRPLLEAGDTGAGVTHPADLKPCHLRSPALWTDHPWSGFGYLMKRHKCYRLPEGDAIVRRLRITNQLLSEALWVWAGAIGRHGNTNNGRASFIEYVEPVLNISP